MGEASTVSEILLPSKTTKFPFQIMDYSPWSSKNLIDWNWLNKFTQVGVDVTCMYIDFGGRGLNGLVSEILLLSNLVKFPFQTMDMGVKK